MTDARHAQTYEHRIWKVSKALDRLSLLCEQHMLQMKHKQGRPEWKIPSVPAGIPSKEHIQVPTFFAWSTSSSLQEETKDEMTQTSDSVVNASTSTQDLVEDSPQALCEEEQSPLNEKHEPLPPKEEEIKVNQPHQHVQIRPESTGSTRLLSTKRPPSGVVPVPNSTTRNPFYQSTYQASFQWPCRGDLERVMEQVGGKTAGGETYYMRRPVFTADAAKAVAQEAAQDFLHKTLIQEEEKESSKDDIRPVTPPRPLSVVETTPEPPVVPEKTLVEDVKTVEVANTTTEPSNPQPNDDTLKMTMERLIPARTASVHTPRQTQRLTNDLKKNATNQSSSQKTSTIRRREKSIGSNVPPPPPKSTPRRLQYPSSTTHFTNPILMHARYPPEPPIFSAKTTYSIEFGHKRR